MKTPKQWRDEGLGWITEDIIAAIQEDARACALTEAIMVAKQHRSHTASGEYVPVSVAILRLMNIPA